MEPRDDPAVGWLLESDPAVRRLAEIDLCGEGSAVDPLDSPRVQALLAFPTTGHPYRKWTGAHWRLVSLVELGVPAGHPDAVLAAQPVLDWLTGEQHLAGVKTIDGLARRCASQEGNALAATVRLGLAEDPRVRRLAEGLVGWQWPDGGWNCDGKASGRRSSFHETLPPVWGLSEFAQATGDDRAADAADRAAELLLDHRVFLRSGSGPPIHPEWTRFHYPPYWHYDALQALLVLSRRDALGDGRADAALDLVERRREADGRWSASRPWWGRPGGTRAPEVVDWGRDGPSDMVTLNALRVLRAGGRWP